MAESGVREIQLSGKQLVFLFMASVVLVVVVFLLGVSVGRGARASAGPAASTDVVAATEKPIDAPPGTTASAANLTYQKQLPGTAGPAKVGDPSAGSTSSPNPPATTADTPRMNVPVPPATPLKTPPALGQTPAPEATSAVKVPAPAAASKPAAPTGSWFVQVESYRSKDLADALVAKLKTKGYDAFIVDVPKPLLHVRVGPYPQRSVADGVAVQLKKDGFSSLVTH